MESTSIKLQQLDLPTTLLQLLSNTIIYDQTIPYLPVSSILALGATNKSFKNLINTYPGTFRYLDLTIIKKAQFQIAPIDNGGEVWRNVQIDENVTEDDFYGGPIRGIVNTLERRGILNYVQILILDGLSVTSDLVADIILQDHFNVRILSIREVQNLNERKLQQALVYAVRPSRATGTPRLQGLYIFGAKDALPAPRTLKASNHQSSFVGGVMLSPGAQIGAQWNQKSGNALAEEMTRGGDKWFQGTGKVITKAPSLEWANTMLACEGIISFDAVLCGGPRHHAAISENDSRWDGTAWYNRRCAHLSSRVSTHSLGSCSGCRKSPEGFSKFLQSPMDRFPLLAPVPLHSSSVKSAKIPFHDGSTVMLARCLDCLRNRYCESCSKWWCEDCYQVPDHSGAPWDSNPHIISEEPDKNVKIGVLRSCFECGPNCAECIERTQLMCRICGGGYCAVHNEGSTLTSCDWCSRSGRRTREMY